VTIGGVQSGLQISWLSCRGWFSDQPHDQPGWIGIADGRIVQMTDTAPAAPASVLVPHAPLYAMPLLADTHVHVYMEPWPVEPAKRALPGGNELEAEVTSALHRVHQALRSGVGLIRDMGDPHGINLQVKRRLAENDLPAPELLVAGPGFHRPKKYGRFLGVCCQTADDVCRSIDRLHTAGEIDFVKVVTTGIVDFAERRVKQAPQFSVEELSRVVAHAHELGYPVASHCSGQEGIDINLDAGVDFIEHAYFVRPDQIDRMADQNVAWTPTFAPVDVQARHPGCGWPDDLRRTIESILDEHADRIAHATSKGVKILAGTDAGSPGVEIGTGLRVELKRLTSAGISAAEALRMATVGNARALGAEDYSPTLQVGAPGSLALYEKCPWRNIENLNSLRHVFWKCRQIC
jgi:imidazolonepropionase-like amidohydrolase